MAFGTQGKIADLMKFNKTDASVQNEYNTVQAKYNSAKKKYSLSKEEYKSANERVELAKEQLSNASITRKLAAYRNYRNAKNIMLQKKQKYIDDKAKYKQELAEFRHLKREIGKEYKAHRQYIKFFKTVQKANQMGIQLPKYIIDEYKNEKNTYLSEKYTIDPRGNRTFLTKTNPTYSKDVSSLIMEKRAKDIAAKGIGKMQSIENSAKNVAAQVKSMLPQNREQDDSDER